MTPTDTARILVQALPYIRHFAGKAVVVKLGGAALDAELDQALAQDVLLLRSVGVRCVLVHGGGPQVDEMMRRLDMKPEFKDGLRVTNADTLEVVRMVLVGKINRDLVGTINREALDDPVAVGVSGEGAAMALVDIAGRCGAAARACAYARACAGARHACLRRIERFRHACGNQCGGSRLLRRPASGVLRTVAADHAGVGCGPEQ